MVTHRVGARRALITGITGQDGSYLAELLLEKGYEVHGIVRRTAGPNTGRIDHLAGQVVLHEGDLLDQGSLERVVYEAVPHEIYNLAAQTFVGTSWQQPVLTAEITALGTLRLLEVLRSFNTTEVRVYQASSSEMFGNASLIRAGKQNEKTPFSPRSPYGVAKVFAHQAAVNYRESYDMHVSCGILFNHESPRRGPEFVTRKIAAQVAEIATGARQMLSLGNLAARRDWGWAPDYVNAMWLMLQQDTPGDYVIATGETHSVREFVEAAVSAAQLDNATVLKDDTAHRPAELHYLCGDASKALKKLGWEPTVGFEELVKRMVEAEISARWLAKDGITVRG